MIIVVTNISHVCFRDKSCMLHFITMDSIKDGALETVAASRFAALVSVVLACLVIRSLYRAFVTPLRGIPGPFAAKFSRIWKLVEVLKGHFEKTDIALHRKYGL